MVPQQILKHSLTTKVVQNLSDNELIELDIYLRNDIQLRNSKHTTVESSYRRLKKVNFEMVVRGIMSAHDAFY